MVRPAVIPPALFVEDVIGAGCWLLRIDSNVSSLSGWRLLIGEVCINPFVENSLSEKR